MPLKQLTTLDLSNTIITHLKELKDSFLFNNYLTVLILNHFPDNSPYQAGPFLQI